MAPGYNRGKPGRVRCVRGGAWTWARRLHVLDVPFAPVGPALARAPRRTLIWPRMSIGSPRTGQIILLIRVRVIGSLLNSRYARQCTVAIQIEPMTHLAIKTLKKMLTILALLES